MNTARQSAVIAAFLFTLVVGCGHKANPVPQQAQAPAPPPSSMVHFPALPPLFPPNTPNVILVAEQEPAPPARQHRTVRRKPSPSKPASSAESTTPTATEKPSSTQQTQAAAGTSPDVSPIGQLTSGGDATNVQQRHDTEQLINNTEKGLNNIGRTLTPNEQETATQIKTFLAKAKQSLTDNDLDGAHTLATKAKVLLDELIKK